jgi:hypothetical protein
MKMRKNGMFLILILSICLVFLNSQSSKMQETKKEPFNPEKKFSVIQLQDDFVVFREALEEGHGGLYRYTPKEQLDRQFDSIYKNLNQPLNEIEFYRQLAPLIANINDGHSRVNLSDSYESYLAKQPILLPFKLKFIQGKAYLFRNYRDDENFVNGGEMVSINERPLSKVVEQMLAVLPSDGHIQTSKYRRLESTAFFGQLYTLLFGRTTSFSIAYRSPEDNSLKTIKVKGLTIQELNSILEQRYPDASRSLLPYELEYRDNFAILTIRTFSGMGGRAYQRPEISYPKFLEKAFSEFEEKKIKYLIIDLRNNGGGSDLFGKLLAAYFIDKPFQYYEALEVKKNEFSFFAHTNIPPGKRKLSEERFRKNERGWYDSLGHPNLGIQKPLKPTFKGKVYILINGGSFSATGECTSVIHFHKKALFVGEECGAGYYGNTSGFVPTLILPHTQIRVRIPLVRYTMAVSGYAKDRGIIPDYPVIPTIKDILNGKDTELDFVIKLIKK